MIFAGPERPVGIAAHALVVAGADRSLAQHVVRAGDDDLVLAGAFHLRLPPLEGLGRHRARVRGAARDLLQPEATNLDGSCPEMSCRQW